MKKEILSILMMTCIISFAPAQSRKGQSFKSGRQDIMAGIGLIPSQFVSGKSEMLPLHIAWEYRCNKALSMGLLASRSSSRTRNPELEGDWKNETTALSARLMGHCSRLKKWDVYGGVALVYLHEKTSAGEALDVQKMYQAGIKPTDNKLVYTALLGAKRCMGKRFTVFAEAGYGTSLLLAGVGYLVRN